MLGNSFLKEGGALLCVPMMLQGKEFIQSDGCFTETKTGGS